MPTYRTLIGFAVAVALAGCATVKDPLYQLKYPAESHSIGGKVMILATKKCKVNRQDCPVEVIPTTTPGVDGCRRLSVRNASNKWIQWLIKDPENWTFADPGIVFKTQPAKQNSRALKRVLWSSARTGAGPDPTITRFASSNGAGNRSKSIPGWSTGNAIRREPARRRGFAAIVPRASRNG